MEKKCRSCGLLIPKGAMFCRHCKKLQDVYPTVIICSIIFSLLLVAGAIKDDSLPNLPAPDTSYSDIKSTLPQSVIAISQKDLDDYQTACMFLKENVIMGLKNSGRIVEIFDMPHVRVIDKESRYIKVRVLEGKNKDLIGWTSSNTLAPRMADFKVDSAPITKEKK